MKDILITIGFWAFVIVMILGVLVTFYQMIKGTLGGSSHNSDEYVYDSSQDYDDDSDTDDSDS